MSEETIEDVWESRLAFEREVARLSTENEHLRNRLREMQEHSTEQLEEIRATKRALSITLVRAENSEEAGVKGTIEGLKYALDYVLRIPPTDSITALAEYLVGAIRALGG